MLFQTSTKLTFGLSDVFVVTVIASNGPLLFCDRILWFSKNMPQSLKSHPPLLGWAYNCNNYIYFEGKKLPQKN